MRPDGLRGRAAPRWACRPTRPWRWPACFRPARQIRRRPSTPRLDGYRARRGRRRVALEAAVRRPSRRRPDPRDRSRRRRRACPRGERGPAGGDRAVAGRRSVRAADIVALESDGAASPREDTEAIRAIAAAYGTAAGSRCWWVPWSGRSATRRALGHGFPLEGRPGNRPWPVHRHGPSARSLAGDGGDAASLQRPPAGAPLGATPTGGAWRASPLAPRSGAPRDPGAGPQGGRGRKTTESRQPCGRRAVAGGCRHAGGSAAWAPPRRTSWRRALGPDRSGVFVGRVRRRPVSSRRTVPGWRLSPPTWMRCAQKLSLAAKQFLHADGRAVLQQQGIFYRQLGAGPAADCVSLCRAGVAVSGHVAVHWSRTCRPPRPPCTLRRRSCSEKAIRPLPKSPGRKPGSWAPTCFSRRPSVLLADAIMLAALADRGIRPDVIAGHSYGEYVALMAAGAWEFDGGPAGHPGTLRRDRSQPGATRPMLAIQAALPRGPEAYRQAPPTRLRGQSQCPGPGCRGRIARGAGGNGRTGGTPVVPGAAPARALPVPHAADGARRPSGSTGRCKASKSAARTPVFSVVTNRRVVEPAEIRANLVAHMTHPVHYVDLIQQPRCRGGHRAGRGGSAAGVDQSAPANSPIAAHAP